MTGAQTEAQTGAQPGALTGALTVVGLGPGPLHWLTPEAAMALKDADHLIGYHAYLRRITPQMSAAKRHASDNREELDRACQAFKLAESGMRVAVVSGGDPGVFAMASAVFEALETGPSTWRSLQVTVLPGVTAITAAAARLGAPLGHDFCAISLSTNLKPWSIIAHRLTAAATADFVIGLYNPVSQARPDALDRAFELLRAVKSGATPVVFAAAIGRDDEAVRLETLTTARASLADMRTLVLIGSSQTRLIRRPNNPEPYVYTPRSYGHTQLAPGETPGEKAQHQQLLESQATGEETKSDA